jgi:hypothetical protein
MARVESALACSFTFTDNAALVTVGRVTSRGVEAT